MKLVHFGAGNIGRGAIPEIFKDVYQHIVFVDLNQDLVNKINNTSSYVIEKTQNLKVENYSAINLKDEQALIEQLQSADLVSTSCGFNNLQGVANILNKVKFDKNVYVICFENNVRPTSQLKTFITNKQQFTFVDCIIDRIVPNQEKHDGLNVKTEDYLSVVIEKLNSPYFINCHQVDKLDDYIKLKLFGVNGLHYVLAVLAHNAGCYYVHEAFENESVVKKIQMWIEFSALYMKNNAANIDQNFVKKYLQDNLMRFNNHDLKDECTRIARNSILKLANDNRVVPIVENVINDAKSSSKQKIDIIEIFKELYHYKNLEDEDSKKIQVEIQKIGLEKTILKYSNLKV